MGWHFLTGAPSIVLACIFPAISLKSGSVGTLNFTVVFPPCTFTTCQRTHSGWKCMRGMRRPTTTWTTTTTNPTNQTSVEVHEMGKKALGQRTTKVKPSDLHVEESLVGGKCFAIIIKASENITLSDFSRSIEFLSWGIATRKTNDTLFDTHATKTCVCVAYSGHHKGR